MAEEYYRQYCMKRGLEFIPYELMERLELDELKNNFPKNIQLTIFSLSPMLHSANCYDYRNHYVRSINKLLRAFCEQTKMVYIDMYTPYKDEFGKLKTAFADSPQITADLIKKIV